MAGEPDNGGGPGRQPLRSGHAGQPLRSGHAGQPLRSGHAGQSLPPGHAGQSLPPGHAGRPRIVRVVTRLNIGGPARHVLLLSRALAGEYDTTLVAGTPETDEGEMSDPAVPVHYVPLVRPVHPPTDVRAFPAVRRVLAERRPALLATHMAKAGTVGRLAASTLRDRPVLVHTFHGHVLSGYFKPATQRAVARTEAWLARRTDALVAVSAEVRDELLALGVGSPSQYHVISPGLDLTSFLAIEGPKGDLRSHIGVEPHTALVGVVGRLVPIKDHDTLLRAMGRLDGVHLAVLGDGESRGRLTRLAQDMGLAHRVHFVGWWKDVATALSDIDVVALTSRNEGTPVALIEASAAGRPVVSTDVGGVGTVVEHGLTGLLTRAGDDEGVAEAVGRLLDDAPARDRLGAAGRQRAEARFGEARLLDDIRALYADLLRRRSPRRRGQ